MLYLSIPATGVGSTGPHQAYGVQSNPERKAGYSGLSFNIQGLETWLLGLQIYIIKPSK